MKQLLTLTEATLVLSSSFAMAAQHSNIESVSSKTQTAYQYDSSNDNGRNDDQ